MLLRNFGSDGLAPAASRKSIGEVESLRFHCWIVGGGVSCFGRICILFFLQLLWAYKNRGPLCPGSCFRRLERHQRAPCASPTSADIRCVRERLSAPSAGSAASRFAIGALSYEVFCVNRSMRKMALGSCAFVLLFAVFLTFCFFGFVVSVFKTLGRILQVGKQLLILLFVQYNRVVQQYRDRRRPKLYYSCVYEAILERFKKCVVNVKAASGSNDTGIIIV